MGDQDLVYPNPTIPDGMHDWTLSAALEWLWKGYPIPQPVFSFARYQQRAIHHHASPEPRLRN